MPTRSVWHRPQLSKLVGVRSNSRRKSLKTLETRENLESTPFSRNRMLSKLERSQYSVVVRPNVPEIKLGSRLSLYLGDEGSARAIEMLSKLAWRKPNLDNCGHRHSCLCWRGSRQMKNRCAGLEVQALHLAKAQTRVSVPHASRRLFFQSLLTARYTATGASASHDASAMSSGMPHCASTVRDTSAGEKANARLVATRIPIATATPAATAIAWTTVMTRDAARIAS